MSTSVSLLSGKPLFGNLQEYRNNRLGLLRRASATGSHLSAFRVGSRTVLLVNAPHLVQQVLVEQAHRFEKTPLLRRFAGPVLGNGLLTSENEFHKRQRRLVAPAFQHRRIATYAEVMADYTDRMQASWADGEVIDIASEMMRLTLWIVGRTLFDADVLADAEGVGQALSTSMHWFNRQLAAVLPVPLSWPTPRNRQAQRASQHLDAVIYRMIHERRASGADHGDLLSMLLHARDEDDGSFMTDQQVRDEAMTLFLAGHETTAVALAWAHYLLTQHPIAYARLRAEVDTLLAGRLPIQANLAQLPYTLRVVKETLRLYPPAYVFGRMAVQPVELDGDTFPAGSIFLISPYTMHHRADLFPEPERFDPDRWTPEAEARLPRHAYLPFGGGPRVCIGNHFALMEAQIVLATLAQRVIVDLVPGQQIVPEPLVTLRPRDGVRVVVTRRTSQMGATTSAVGSAAIA